MSVIVAAMVWQLRGLMISSEKFLFVCLADQANDDGLTVFLNGGTNELAARCEISRSTCKRQLDRLEQKGWIKVAVEQAQHRPRQYQLNLTKLRENQPNGGKSRGVKLNPLENPGGSSASIQGGHPEAQGGHPEHPGGSNGACHIRNNYVLHEEHGEVHGDRTPLLASASPGNGTENGEYRKLAESCRISLPATAREDAQLQAALVDLRKKMQADLEPGDTAPVSPSMIRQAIKSLLLFWTSEDWRGKRGESPLPSQLIECYGAARVWLANYSTRAQ